VIERLRRNAGLAALVLSVLSIVMSTTGLADAAKKALFGASTKPRPYGLLLLGRNAKFPASAIPTVSNASKIAGKSVSTLEPSCPSATIDFGTYCIATNLYQVPPVDGGLNNYFYATRACANEGGYLPSAAQLIGAANRASLASVLTDNPATSTIDTPESEASTGLLDLREMSSSLVTTTAGSDAAGSEGVSQGAKGNPNSGQPNPTPQPANPEPETLQYVTVYDNFQMGGFAGSESVSTPENFRCAFDKVPPNSKVGPNTVVPTHSRRGA
jgi:hypothetical protein